MKTHGLFARSFLDFDLRDMDLPPLGDDDVLVKVHACGVCGTDLHFARDTGGDYHPLGHEIAGEILETGRNVRRIGIGDRVIVEDCSMCGTCVDCKNGEPELCRKMYDLGGRPGMAEYMVVHERLCDAFDGLDFVSASLTEPQAVAINAVLHADIPLAGDVIVFGPGPIGLMCVRLSKLRGAAAVGLVGYQTDRPMEKIRTDVGRKLGADFVIDSAREDPVEAVHAHFPNGPDRVIVTSPPESMEKAIETGRFGEKVSFIGIHLGGRSRITLDVNDLIFRKRTLVPTFAEPAIKFPTSLKILKAGLMPAQEIITHTFRLDEHEKVFRGLLDASQPIIKAVCTPHG